jgi:hypothetical protein
MLADFHCDRSRLSEPLGLLIDVADQLLARMDPTIPGRLWDTVVLVPKFNETFLVPLSQELGDFYESLLSKLLAVHNGHYRIPVS